MADNNTSLAICAAVGLGKCHLNKYYGLTDTFPACKIALGECIQRYYPLAFPALSCPEIPPTSSNSAASPAQPSLPLAIFIAYALHHTRLHLHGLRGVVYLLRIHDCVDSGLRQHLVKFPGLPKGLRGQPVPEPAKPVTQYG